MDESNFIILLARQRSGTNALRSVLRPHPDIRILGAVFNIAEMSSENTLLRETNFFTFLKKYAEHDISRIFPDHHEKLFKDYLDYLREFSSKPYTLLDIKFNNTHFLSGFYKPIVAPPHLFGWLVANKVKVFVLTRKNYLRYALSLLKASVSGRFGVKTSEAGYTDVKIQVNVKRLLRQLEDCHAEDHLIASYFSSYPHYFSCDYADVFEASGRVAGEFLDSFAKWLGIPNKFKDEPSLKKLSRLPLEETVENFDEVVEALSGTKFEYCLEDEKLYRSLSPGAEATDGEPRPLSEKGA